MQLKYLKTLLAPQKGAAKICCLAYSPNNEKLAVCTYDRVILLYDEQGEKRDKFSTKPADPKYGKKSYMVKAMAFSPDGAKLAVGQTDNIIFVYKLGSDWGEQKTIRNKFVLPSAVTCLVWLPDDKIVFGTDEGKVRMANVKSNKSSSIYDATSYVVSLAVSPNGKGILSGHADGTIVRYFFENDGNGDTNGKLCVHPCPPYALAWGSTSFVAAGCDKRVFAYSRDGRIMQQFDFSKEEDEHEFTCAVCSPSGQSVVIGSFDRLRVFNWSPRKGLWDEGKSKDIANLYTVTALAWKRDGSKLVAGSLCGGVELFDCCLKKMLYKNKFEVSHVGPSQVNIKDLSTGSRFSLKSYYAYEIDEVKIMGGDQYVVAHTSDTLMLADLTKKSLSEVPWRGSGGNEKYIFDHENACVIFNAGELTLIEYGKNEVLGSVRTEFISRHLISVRINERKQKGAPDNKKIAYLVDLKTIAIVDLVTALRVGNVSHDTKIGWLELNETGRKLLFRDSKLRLHLYDVETENRTTILNYCSYVQWVPGSDVVVAQNREYLCVWYNIDAPERVKMDPIKGDIVDVERHDGRTDVIVSEGLNTVTYTLDGTFIEFGTALYDGDYARAVAFLEMLEMTPETEAMWKTLSKLSLDAQQLIIAERCFAALGDVAKARYLHETNTIAEEAAKTMGGNGFNHYKVRARLAIMEKNFKLAESIYLEQNQVDEAMAMYQELHKWDEAISVAEAKNHPDLEKLRRSHYQWLMETHQEDRAGELKEREGDDIAAINLYMKAGMPARAAKVITGRDELMNNEELVARVSSALIKGDMYERAGDLYEKLNKPHDAIQCYRKGAAFRRAVDLARHTQPEEVVKLEMEWGNYLVHQKQLDAAINHFIEAGDNLKAVDAAISSRQWQKAGQILQVIKKQPEVCVYYKKLAQHYANIGEYEVAEGYFQKADSPLEAVNMYNLACKWEDAYRVALSCMKESEIKDSYIKQAEELKVKGRYKDAERLYLTVKDTDEVIKMYRDKKMYNDLIRVTKQYRKQELEETLSLCGKMSEQDRLFRQAEHFYLEGNKVTKVIAMYGKEKNWEDCYRVAKARGTPDQALGVAFYWSYQVGGESAAKLLTKLGLFDEVIEHAISQGRPEYFEFASDLCRIAKKEMQPEVLKKYGDYYESLGHYAEAEAEYIKAGIPKDAVLMYVNCRDWESARRVAEQYDPTSVPDILIGSARSAFKDKDFQKAESYLLQAQKPEFAVQLYKDAGMWQDALRVCKDYSPNLFAEVQSEYDREMANNVTRGAEAYVRQAQEWESKREYAMAVDSYVRVTPEITSDPNVLQKCYQKATEMALKFLDVDKATRVVLRVCPILVEVGRYNAAAELYLKVNRIKEAIDAYIAGEDWTHAKTVAATYEPELKRYVDDKYTQYLKDKDKLDALEGVDVEAALEKYVARGDWSKAISIAEKKSPKLLHKYVASYAANLVKSDKVVEALGLYVQHGAPALSSNFNIYRHIFNDVIEMPNTNTAQSYKLWSDLRDVFSDLCTNLGQSQQANGSDHEEFEAKLTIAHYYATRSAALPNSSLATIATKLSVSLLRHTDIIPADKAFYEAGMMCKAVGYEDMACVFLNRYLDLVEAIEDESLDLDQEDIRETDIPLEIPLPKKPYVSATLHEEVKEWVLAVAMDRKVSRQLRKDERDTYEASLIDAQSGTKSLPCVITGYPVLKNRIEFKHPNKAANKEDWNKLLLAVKTSPSSELRDVIKFIDDWCGIPSNASHTFGN